MNSETTVEQLLAQVDAASPDAPDRAFSLWVSEALTLRGEPVSQNVAMALVLDRLLAKGFFPAGFEPAGAGRLYNYRFEGT
jgi:hypothetical protein